MKVNEELSNLLLNADIAFSFYISWIQIKILNISDFKNITLKSSHRRSRNININLLKYKINRISRFIAIDSCLPKSLTTYKVLTKYGLSPKLIIGVKKSLSTLKSHAWIELDGNVFNDDANACASFKEIKRY